MSRFIESIKFEKGMYHLLSWHQQRIDRTFQANYPLTIPFHLHSHLPDLDFDNTYKVRICYNNHGVDVEFAEYKKRTVEALHLVHADFDYRFKSENRKNLNALTADLDVHHDVIIVKNNCITDSSYSNLAFLKNGRWFTPKTFLLNGVKRQHYLSLGIIKEADITLDNIWEYEKVCLLNAMLDLDEITIDLSKVIALI